MSDLPQGLLESSKAFVLAFWQSYLESFHGLPDLMLTSTVSVNCQSLYRLRTQLAENTLLSPYGLLLVLGPESCSEEFKAVEFFMTSHIPNKLTKGAKH